MKKYITEINKNTVKRNLNLFFFYFFIKTLIIVLILCYNLKILKERYSIMCKCSYCNSTKNVKSTAYGLYAMYTDICIDCYNKLENRNKYILKKEAI